MTISAVDLFSIGIGPSSSHTVGPMRAAAAFVAALKNRAEQPARIRVNLCGSLAATGRGHGTDRAVVLGLAGYDPQTVPEDVHPKPGEDVPPIGTISGPTGTVSYEIVFDPRNLELHPNGMVFTLLDEHNEALAEPDDYYSVGGGFIQSGDDLRAAHDAGDTSPSSSETSVPYPFSSSAELMAHCSQTHDSIAKIMAQNEEALHSLDGGYAATKEHLDAVWRTMCQCVTAGITHDGVLPGGLNVVRRAPELYRRLLALEAEDRNRGRGGFGAMEWVNLYALAVNEENAAGGRVVTAPTNGAAGIIPAVMHYARDFVDGFTRETARTFLLTAAAIGIIVKENASISGAEVGCQGEVGSASAMAAGGLCVVLGGTPVQVENAAEIGLEHNLGLTCDPVGGLVQIPCIERNAIGAVKSINAARLALLGNGTSRVTLDDVIQTMAETGRDMHGKYKETAAGGLAITLGLPVNVTEC